jgi:predicted alpha/beta hydrolase family esterase
MTARHVLILHGWQGSGPDHWQTWLAERLRDGGDEVRYPTLPECDTPCPDQWGFSLHMELAALGHGGERIVVCHSLGCVLWLREAHRVRARDRVDRVLLVAPPCPGCHIEELAGFFPTGAQADRIGKAAASTRLVCSDNDPYCPQVGAAEHWGATLALPVDLIPGGGHLNPDAGYGPWPAVQEWVLGRRDALAARRAPVEQ